MSSRKFSLEAYFLIKARSETPTYRFNSVGHCSNASDSNVSWGKGRMTVTFDTDGVNSLTLVGVQELKMTDFEHAFIA